MIDRDLMEVADMVRLRVRGPQNRKETEAEKRRAEGGAPMRRLLCPILGAALKLLLLPDGEAMETTTGREGWPSSGNTSQE